MASTSFLKIISAAALCAGVSIAALQPASAGVSVGIGINLTPPPDRVEVVPRAPRPGVVWIRGHWNRAGGQWVWVGGRWDRPPRPGGVWVRGHYAHRAGGVVWVRGHWR
jgi:WXXGXW repeat (2 copies)